MSIFFSQTSLGSKADIHSSELSSFEMLRKSAIMYHECLDVLGNEVQTVPSDLNVDPTLLETWFVYITNSQLSSASYI